MDCIGFVCNAFVQFIICRFTGLFFCSYFPIGIRICCINFLIRFSLRINVSCIGFFSNGIGIGFNLGIESRKVSPHTIGLDYVVSGLRCIIVNSFRFYFPCYRYITTRGDITSRNRTGSQLPTDLQIFDGLIFFGSYNQISILGNMQSRAGLIRCKLIRIGFDLCIQCNDIFTYRIAGRYIITAGKGIIHNALHADDFIFSGNIGLGNDFVTIDGRLGSQGTFDQSIAIHVQVATAVQAARIDGTAYIGVVTYADRIGHAGRAGGDATRSVDTARGNGIAFNGGRGRRSSIIISKGCPGRFSSSNLGIFSCSISRSINNLSI